MNQNYVLAPRFVRLQARLWDMMFCWWPLFFGFAALSCMAAGPRGPEEFYLGCFGISALISGVLSLYNLFLLLRTGQTWGKRRVGVLVVMATGERATQGSLLWRCISPMVVAMVPLVGMITYFDAFFIFSESRRCLHDHLASTMVVDASSYQEPGPEGTGLCPSDIGFSSFSSARGC